jgi:hypothetical protein
VRKQVDGVGANGHELAMRHVDDTHLAEDDGQAQAHEQQHGKQAQPGKALHQADVEHFGKIHGGLRCGVVKVKQEAAKSPCRLTPPHGGVNR